MTLVMNLCLAVDKSIRTHWDEQDWVFSDKLVGIYRRILTTHDLFDIKIANTVINEDFYNHMLANCPDFIGLDQNAADIAEFTKAGHKWAESIKHLWYEQQKHQIKKEWQVMIEAIAENIILMANQVAQSTLAEIQKKSLYQVNDKVNKISVDDVAHACGMSKLDPKLSNIIVTALKDTLHHAISQLDQEWSHRVEDQIHAIILNALHDLSGQNRPKIKLIATDLIKELQLLIGKVLIQLHNNIINALQQSSTQVVQLLKQIQETGITLEDDFFAETFGSSSEEKLVQGLQQLGSHLMQQDLASMVQNRVGDLQSDDLSSQVVRQITLAIKSALLHHKTLEHKRTLTMTTEQSMSNDSESHEFAENSAVEKIEAHAAQVEIPMEELAEIAPVEDECVLQRDAIVTEDNAMSALLDAIEEPLQAVTEPAEEAAVEPVEEAVAELVEVAAEEPTEEAAAEPAEVAAAEPAEMPAAEPEEMMSNERVQTAASDLDVAMEKLVQGVVNAAVKTTTAEVHTAISQTLKEVIVTCEQKDESSVALPERLAAQAIIKYLNGSVQQLEQATVQAVIETSVKDALHQALRKALFPA